MANIFVPIYQIHHGYILFVLNEIINFAHYYQMYELKI